MILTSNEVGYVIFSGDRAYSMAEQAELIRMGRFLNGKEVKTCTKSLQKGTIISFYDPFKHDALPEGILELRVDEKTRVLDIDLETQEAIYRDLPENKDFRSRAKNIVSGEVKVTLHHVAYFKPSYLKEHGFDGRWSSDNLVNAASEVNEQIAKRVCWKFEREFIERIDQSRRKMLDKEKTQIRRGSQAWIESILRV